LPPSTPRARPDESSTTTQSNGLGGDAAAGAGPNADLLTEQQKAENTIFFRGNSGWGLGFQVFTRLTTLGSTPGRFGWTGGTGTSVYTDPAEELIGILLTQREMTSPEPPTVFRDFWTCAYQAIDD
jgi:CubicO group peptidase (beta-lactamase class C family)